MKANSGKAAKKPERKTKKDAQHAHDRLDAAQVRVNELEFRINALTAQASKGDVAGRVAGLHSQQIDQLQSDVRFLKERKGDDLLHMKIDRVVESHGNKITELVERIQRLEGGKTSEIKQLQPNQLAMVVFSAKRGNIHNVLLYPATEAGRRQIQVDERRLNTAGYVCDAPWLALDPSYVDAWLGDDEEFGS